MLASYLPTTTPMAVRPSAAASAAAPLLATITTLPARYRAGDSGACTSLKRLSIRPLAQRHATLVNHRRNRLGAAAVAPAPSAARGAPSDGPADLFVPVPAPPPSSLLLSLLSLLVLPPGGKAAAPALAVWCSKTRSSNSKRIFPGLNSSPIAWISSYVVLITRARCDRARSAKEQRRLRVCLSM